MAARARAATAAMAATATRAARPDGSADGGAGATLVGTGCSATCTVEPGFACAAPPAASACHATTCGDGKKEGYEQCDDGNRVPYDGCSPTCQIEPKCNGTGGCTGVCGDGLVFPGEQCDDGNTLSGDGCSATCTIEPGFTCNNAVQPPAATLAIPILYRDMMYWNTSSFPNPAPPGGGHPDFNHYGSGNVTGLVEPTLGPDGEPVFKSSGSSETLTSATSFCWWYHETGCEAPDAGATDAAAAGDGGATDNPYSALVSKDALGNPTTLTLTKGASGTYTYANAQFFPVDGLGWNAGSNPQVDTDCEPGLPNGPHNFSFTSELHYVFTFDASVAASSAPAVFSFTGDDSVWAFINGQLVVDLGGVHSPASGTYTLDTAHANTLGLVDGGWYSIDVFQAEEHTCRSTYNLTLSNFVHIVSACQSVCGDGVVAGHEQCDTGASNVPPPGRTARASARRAARWRPSAATARSTRRRANSATTGPTSPSTAGAWRRRAASAASSLLTAATASSMAPGALRQRSEQRLERNGVRRRSVHDGLRDGAPLRRRDPPDSVRGAVRRHPRLRPQLPAERRTIGTRSAGARRGTAQAFSPETLALLARETSDCRSKGISSDGRRARFHQDTVAPLSCEGAAIAGCGCSSCARPPRPLTRETRFSLARDALARGASGERGARLCPGRFPFS